VIAVSSLLRRPVNNASGMAIARATSIPDVRFRKLCPTSAKNPGSDRHDSSVRRAAEKDGNLDAGTIPNRTIASHARKIHASDANHKYFSTATM